MLGVVSWWFDAFPFPRNAGDAISVGTFSTLTPGGAFPEAWRPLVFKGIEKHTRYALVRDADTTVILAEADDSASGLVREIEIDPRKYPIIRWRWKITNVLEGGDVHRKSGDDYPARLYVTFLLDPDKYGLLESLKYRAIKLFYGRYPPSGAINYIWANKAPKGTMVANAYTDRAMMFVLESGEEKLNRWVWEERNVYEDYKQAFDGEPPPISGVAVMTDTDDTGGRAKAYYGDILFKRTDL